MSAHWCCRRPRASVPNSIATCPFSKVTACVTRSSAVSRVGLQRPSPSKVSRQRLVSPILRCQRVLPPHAVTPPRRPEPADPAHNHAQERSDVGHVAIDAQINGDASEWRGRAAARRSAPAVVADARRLVAPARGVPYACSKSCIRPCQ